MKRDLSFRISGDTELRCVRGVWQCGRMIYLYTPGEQPRWAKIPAEHIPDLNDKRADLEAIEWLPVEEFKHTPELVGIALRRGEAVPGGVAVSWRHFDALRRIGRAESYFRFTEEYRPQNDRSDALIETVWPGWTEGVARENAEGDEIHREMIEEARAEIKQILAEPVDEAVAAHWVRLGGSI